MNVLPWIPDISWLAEEWRQERLKRQNRRIERRLKKLEKQRKKFNEKIWKEYYKELNNKKKEEEL